MSPSDWAGLAVAIATLVGSFAMMVRFMVQHYLKELKPNGGSSVKDSVARLERQVEEIYRVLIERGAK